MEAAPLAPVLEDAVAAALRGAFGSAARMQAYRPLSRRVASVGRVWLAGAAQAPATVIVKHLPPRALPGARGDYPEFDEELAAQRFLRARGLEPGLKPRLLGWNDAAFLLEDLGDAPVPARTYGELVPRVARALARLHAGTRGALDEYAAVRGEMGLDGDRRRYGVPAERERFENGRRFILESMAARWRGDRAALARELDVVDLAVSDPGPFLALLHDDLGHGRQTYEVGGDLYLLDFEYAKPGHALLDFMKAIVGKLEVGPAGVYAWTNPGFPRSMLATYRAVLADEHGVTFADEAWELAVPAAIACAAVTLVGRINQMRPGQPLLGDVAPNRNGVLYRLAQLLGAGSPFPTLRNAIRDALCVGTAAAGAARLA